MRRNPLRVQAEKLRDAGYSYNMISGRLGIAKGTLSSWFKDKLFRPNKEAIARIRRGPIQSAEQRHNQKVSNIETLKKLGAAELGKLTKRDLWMLGLGLYLGEGSKSYEIIRITNADPNIIRLAVKWFKETCGLTDENITIALHLYPDNDIDLCIKFWQKETGLPLKNFRKTHIDVRPNKSVIKANKLPYGTAHITIVSNGNPAFGVKLHRKIAGWISGVSSQI
jgi:hypothetical protein